MKTTLILITSVILAGTALAGSVTPYNKKTCIVTDNKLGSMGTPITKVYGSQEVKFCCKPCIKKFEKDPKKYLAKLAQNKK